jgi:uncharacterized phage-associated protein
MTTVFDVANYFLARNNNPVKRDSITALKLQKLVYYAQGHALAILGRPLFDESFHAWELGPVCIPLYERFKKLGKAAPLDRLYETTVEADKALRAAQKPFAQNEINLLEDAFSCYGGYTAWALSEKSHETPPWKDAFPGREISRKAMKKFFSDRLKAAKVEISPLTREEADEMAVRLGVSLQ